VPQRNMTNRERRMSGGFMAEDFFLKGMGRASVKE